MGRRNCFRFATIVFSCGPVLTLAFSLTATAQSVPLPLFASPQPPVLSPRGECLLLTRTMCDGLPSGQNRARNDSQKDPEHGTFHRAATRIWRDQEGLWTAPFKKSNLKWDALVLTDALTALKILGETNWAE
jgi:hypothetical protein